MLRLLVFIAILVVLIGLPFLLDWSPAAARQWPKEACSGQGL